MAPDQRTMNIGGLVHCKARSEGTTLDNPRPEENTGITQHMYMLQLHVHVCVRTVVSCYHRDEPKLMTQPTTGQRVTYVHVLSLLCWVITLNRDKIIHIKQANHQ